MKTMSWLVLLSLLGVSAVAEEARMKVKPAVNEPPAVKVGARPYEMEGRTEERAPLFGFEDIAGWTVQDIVGAEAELVRTREQQMWGEYVGKLRYTGKSAESRVVLRPPAPIRVKDAFDSISMWIRGDVWEWAPEPGTPMVDVSILVTDSSGKEQSIPLTRVRWKEWWLAHRKLAEPMEGAAFSGIEVRGLSNSETRSIFLDSIYFYKEELKPLKFEPRPARNLRLFEGQPQGTNGTGPGKLPFPTREETILPTNFEAEFTNEVTETAPGVYEFTYKAKDAKLTYLYRPGKGGLGEITASVNGAKGCMPMANGGIEFGDNQVGEGKLVSSKLEHGVVTAVFEFGGTKAEYRFRIWQKSLVVDFICRGGKATGIALGEAQKIERPKLVLIPFLTFGASNPRVLFALTGKQPVFVSAWVDWYRSNGSTLWSAEWQQETSAKFNGGVRYLPKTDGRRNDLYERVFLTVSPTFEETLPTIANPPSPHGAAAGERLWQESWGPENYAKEHERSKMLRSYGIDKLTQCNHEITWRDGGESFTLRTKAAPGRGGDKALKDYVAAQKSLGWLSGLYTNYTDFAPVNEHWDEDYVQLTAEGEWRPAWPRNYALKPSRAVELDAKLAKQVQEKFGSNAAYTDVQTAVAPWNYCDFDARVPGAGTFAATFYSYGELLLNDQKVYGPTWSEGTYQWLYAGLATGNYGIMYTGVDLSKEPLNVAFDLMKIHPLECDIGMPWTGGFIKDPGWQTPEKVDESIDHFIAATIAYGHIGWLVEETHGIDKTCRSYYMLQQLQKRYAMQKVAKIEYADDKGGFYSMSEATANGVIGDSRLHVEYENGLEVWVNGSSTNWRVENKKRSILPPWGWAAADDDCLFEEFSALVGGHRVDHVYSPDYEFLDGRGTPTTLCTLNAKGAVAVRALPEGIELIDIGGNDEIGLLLDTAYQCTAYAADGSTLGKVEVRPALYGTGWIKTVEGARRYVLTRAKSVTGRQTGVYLKDCEAVVPGELVTAVVGCTGGDGTNLKGGSAAVEGSKGSEVILPDSGENAYKGSVEIPILLPGDLKPGSWLWIHGTATLRDGGTEESWCVLPVVAAFDIALRDAGDSRFAVDVTNNLHGKPKPEIAVSLKGGSGMAVSEETGSPCVITFAPPAEMKEAADTLVVKVSSGGAGVSREFPVRAVIDHRAIWQPVSTDGFTWGQCLRGAKETSGNTATGASFHTEKITSGGVAKQAIFAHPPWTKGTGYTFGVGPSIKVPNKPCEFRAFIGLKDGGDVSDGVVFKVIAVTGKGEEKELINQTWAKREWKEVSADLSAFAGKSIRLKFITDAGPRDDSTADWAAWGEPRVVEKTPVMRIEVK